MSKIQRFRHDGVDGMASYENGAWVSYEDYAELKAQRDALAAENAAFKGAIQIAKDSLQEHYDTDGVESQDSEGNFMDACIRLCDAQSTIEKLENINLSSTDAYLNSVRAEGIEILTGKLQQLIDEGVFDAKEIGVAAGAVHEGAQMANKLRAGEPS